MSDKSKLITTAFLKEFDYYWNNMLKSIGYNQVQLSSGNRLRPQICLWGFLASKASFDNITSELPHIASVSVSLEMIHKASILIDDWLDEDKVRHGQPAFHTEYPLQDTILVALNLIALSMARLKDEFAETSVKLPHHYFTCLDTVLDTIYAMARGALKELRLKGTEIYDSNTIKEVIQLETAEIIGNCLLLGYYAGIKENKRNVYIENIFKQIGDQCGYLFQAMNDLEVFSNPQKLCFHKGNLNSDIMKQRKNIGVAMLYELASNSDKKILVNLYPLMKKYNVVAVLRRQLNALYENLLLEIDEIQAYGIPLEWCIGFKEFWAYVKKFGENRLEA